MSSEANIKSDTQSESKLCILRAAAGLFAKLGLDKCSTRAIAKKSRSNISLISYYFGGKEGLYKEVMHSYALEIKQNAESIVDNIENKEMTKEVFIRDIDRIIENMIASRLKNPEISKIFAREKLVGLPYSKEIHEEVFYPLILKFYKLFEIGQKKGFVRKDVNPALFFIMLSEGIWGYFELMECKTNLSKDCEGFSGDLEKLKNQILNIYLTGVLI